MFQSPHFKIMVIRVAGSHVLHVQNVYLIHIIQRSWLRHPIVVIALLYVYNSEETKYIMFCVIVQDASPLLLSACSTKENVMTE